jgi:hypothetical protein
MFGFTELAYGEVGGMARVVLKANEFYVSDLRLFPKQKVTGGSVKLDEKLLMGFISSVQNAEEFKFMWHSHVNMGAFLSGTDEGCITSFMMTSPYLISCVTCKDGKYMVRLDLKVETKILQIKCDLTITDDYADLKSEFEENVKQEMVTEVESSNWIFDYENGLFGGNHPYTQGKIITEKTKAGFHESIQKQVSVKKTGVKSKKEEKDNMFHSWWQR